MASGEWFTFSRSSGVKQKNTSARLPGSRGTLNELQWIAYLRSLERRLGPGQREIFFLERTKKAEGQALAVEAYTFSPKDR